jgi:hypothetical protein
MPFQPPTLIFNPSFPTGILASYGVDVTSSRQYPPTYDANFSTPEKMAMESRTGI